MKPASKKRRALSIRQPYVELILRGLKKVEYRGRPTHVRGLIYLYASLQPGGEAGFRKLRAAPGELPTGLVLGTAILAGCRPSRRYPGDFEWILQDPRRLKRPFRPTRQPQPSWFFPR
jgi:hypothetical protein